MLIITKKLIIKSQITKTVINTINEVSRVNKKHKPNYIKPLSTSNLIFNFSNFQLFIFSNNCVNRSIRFIITYDQIKRYGTTHWDLYLLEQQSKLLAPFITGFNLRFDASRVNAIKTRQFIIQDRHKIYIPTQQQKKKITSSKILKLTDNDTIIINNKLNKKLEATSKKLARHIDNIHEFNKTETRRPSLEHVKNPIVTDKIGNELPLAIIKPRFGIPKVNLKSYWKEKKDKAKKDRKKIQFLDQNSDILPKVPSRKKLESEPREDQWCLFIRSGGQFHNTGIYVPEKIQVTYNKFTKKFRYYDLSLYNKPLPITYPELLVKKKKIAKQKKLDWEYYLAHTPHNRILNFTNDFSSEDIWLYKQYPVVIEKGAIIEDVIVTVEGAFDSFNCLIFTSCDPILEKEPEIEWWDCLYTNNPLPGTIIPDKDLIITECFPQDLETDSITNITTQQNYYLSSRGLYSVEVSKYYPTYSKNGYLFYTETNQRVRYFVRSEPVFDEEVGNDWNDFITHHAKEVKKVARVCNYRNAWQTPSKAWQDYWTKQHKLHYIEEHKSLRLSYDFQKEYCQKSLTVMKKPKSDYLYVDSVFHKKDINDFDNWIVPSKVIISHSNIPLLSWENFIKIKLWQLHLDIWYYYSIWTAISYKQILIEIRYVCHETYISIYYYFFTEIDITCSTKKITFIPPINPVVQKFFFDDGFIIPFLYKIQHYITNSYTGPKAFLPGIPLTVERFIGKPWYAYDITQYVTWVQDQKKIGRLTVPGIIPNESNVEIIWRLLMEIITKAPMVMERNKQIKLDDHECNSQTWRLINKNQFNLEFQQEKQLTLCNYKELYNLGYKYSPKYYKRRSIISPRRAYEDYRPTNQRFYNSIGKWHNFKLTKMQICQKPRNIRKAYHHIILHNKFGYKGHRTHIFENDQEDNGIDADCSNFDPHRTLVTKDLIEMVRLLFELGAILPQQTAWQPEVIIQLLFIVSNISLFVVIPLLYDWTYIASFFLPFLIFPKAVGVFTTRFQVEYTSPREKILFNVIKGYTTNFKFPKKKIKAKLIKKTLKSIGIIDPIPIIRKQGFRKIGDNKYWLETSRISNKILRRQFTGKLQKIKRFRLLKESILEGITEIEVNYLNLMTDYGKHPLTKAHLDSVCTFVETCLNNPDLITKDKNKWLLDWQDFTTYGLVELVLKGTISTFVKQESSAINCDIKKLNDCYNSYLKEKFPIIYTHKAAPNPNPFKSPNHPTRGKSNDFWIE